jgi:hypothetical protein
MTRVSPELVIEWVDSDPVPGVVVLDQSNGAEHVVALEDIPALARKIGEWQAEGWFPLYLPEDTTDAAGQVQIRHRDYPGASFALGQFWNLATMMLGVVDARRDRPTAQEGT